MRKLQPRRGGIGFSPGRKPWVKWEKLTSPFRDGTVLTHPLKPLNLVEPLDGTAEAVPFQSDLANAALKRRTNRAGGTVKQPHKITTVSKGGR